MYSRGTKIIKNTSHDVYVDHAPFDLLLNFWFIGLAANEHTKFEISSYTRSRDMEGSQNYKSRSRDTGHALLTYFCIFWFVGLAVNPHTKFKVLNFAHYRGFPRCKSSSRDLDHASFVLKFRNMCKF